MLALTILAVVGLGACGPPTYRFTASAADDLALKVPRTWNLVNSGVPPSSDGTPSVAGNWFAVFDGAAHPSLAHVQAPHTTAPVALVRTVVVAKDQGQSLTDDDLRDLWLPVTAKGRTSAQSQGFTGTGFRLIHDEKITTKTADGVHVVFGYDLGQGMEVFDQVVMTDKNKIRVHLLIVHCSQSCYDSNRQVISDSVRSFTVRRT
jgi:hypothetical protein